MILQNPLFLKEEDRVALLREAMEAVNVLFPKGKVKIEYPVLRVGYDEDYNAIFREVNRSEERKVFDAGSQLCSDSEPYYTLAMDDYFRYCKFTDVPTEPRMKAYKKDEKEVEPEPIENEGLGSAEWAGKLESTKSPKGKGKPRAKKQR